MSLRIIQIIALIGFLLSIYAVHVEKKMQKSKRYKAVCDFNNNVSCTKAFASKYGHMMGISNSMMGIACYLIIYILAAYSYTNIMFYLAALSMLGTIGLAYLSFVKMKNFCMVCNGIYLVNILLLYFTYSLAF